MFTNLSEILKSFSPAQRILALIILVCTIVIVTLGPNWIDSNTSDCTELETRIGSLERQNGQLHTRVEELNTQLIRGQQQCTDNLILKQQEIMGLINGMIAETQSGIRKCEVPVKREAVRIEVDDSQDPTQPRVAMMVREPEPVQLDQATELKRMLAKLKGLKTSVAKTMNDGNK